MDNKFAPKASLDTGNWVAPPLGFLKYNLDAGF